MRVERAGWKVVTLKTLLTTSVRNGYSPVCPEAESGNWVLGLGALNGNGFDPSQKKPAPPNDQKIQDFLLSNGDFLVSRSNTLDKVGRASLFRGEVDNCAYPDLMMRFRVDEKKVNLEYLDTYLRTENIRHYFQIHAAGSSGSMVKITKSILEETPILLPPLPEQEKIASFLGAIATRLNQLRRKRELLQTYKRGVMQKIFAQKIRFKDAIGSEFPDWQKKKLEDISNRIGDGIHSTPRYDDNGEYYFINGNNLINNRIEFSENTKRVNKAEYLKYQNNLTSQTILISINGTIGNIAFYSNEKIVLGKSACYINLKSEQNKFFVFYLLQTSSTKSHFSQEVTGSTIKNLSLAAIKNTKAFFPNSIEQEKIANLLTAIDRKIETLTRQIEQTEKFKKGLLQKLFI